IFELGIFQTPPSLLQTFSIFRRLPPSCKPSPFSDASLPLTHHLPDRGFPLSVASPDSSVVGPQHSPNDRDSVADDSSCSLIARSRPLRLARWIMVPLCRSHPPIQASSAPSAGPVFLTAICG
ncbi:hypothetical protein ACLOJK_010091, partial [Asimina triloba]